MKIHPGLKTKVIRLNKEFKLKHEGLGMLPNP